MARTSRVANPPSTVDALDALNIDDIFAEGSDALFDGLDIDLGHMAEITTDVDDTRTSKNGNGMEKPSPTGDSKPSDFSSPSILDADSSKRRKTKRRARSPVLLEDEDYTMESSKKKRRTSKAAPTKKGKAGTPKASKKQIETGAEPHAFPASSIATSAAASLAAESAGATATLPPNSRTKGKARTSATMPPPVARHSSGGPVSVAAAGQFGGRQRRGGHFSLPLARVTTERQKAKAKAAESTKVRSTSVESAASSQSSEVPSTVPAAPPPPPQAPPLQAQPPRAQAPPPETVATAPSERRQESTFCGLLPSNSLFYPFMPALPVEPSMKNRAKLPVIERINAALTNQVNTASAESEAQTGEANGIYRLLLDSLEQASSTPSGISSVPPEKKTALLHSVSSVLKVIANLDKGRLTLDLYSVCAMLKRQHDFLSQSLCNMDVWCKENFSEQDYALTYGAPDSVGSKQKASVSAFTPLLFGLPSPFIKVKIKCNGFKEPKLSAPLTAMLPPSAVAVGVVPVVKKEPVVKPLTKKRKPPVQDSITSADMARSIKEAEQVVPYFLLRPAQRRQRISEAVAKKAELLEAKIRESELGRRQLQQRRQADLQKVLDDGEAVIHTAAMWQWVEKSPYFATYTEDDVTELLRVAWTPETRKRDLNRLSLLDEAKLIGKQSQEPLSVMEESMFDKLQSLLVDEGGDSCDDDDDDEVDPVVQIWQRSCEDPCVTTLDSLLDGSELSLDERASLVLHSVGLVGDIIPESSDLIPNRQANSGKPVSVPENERDELDELIGRMSTDLDAVCNLNNMRAALLESTAKSYLAKWEARKKKAEDDSNAITKCMQILKKNKENKAKSSRKSAGVRKDEDYLPW